MNRELIVKQKTNAFVLNDCYKVFHTAVLASRTPRDIEASKDKFHRDPSDWALPACGERAHYAALPNFSKESSLIHKSRPLLSLLDLLGPIGPAFVIYICSTMASNDSSRPDDPPDGGGYVGDTPLPKAISWSASMTPELLVVSRSLDANRTSDVLNYLLAVGKQNVEAVRHAYLQNNESYIIGAIHTPQRMLTWMDHNDWKSRCHGPDLEKYGLTVTIDAAAAKTTKFRAAFGFIFASGDLLENLNMRKTKLCLLVSIGTIKVLGSDFSKEQVQQLLTSDSVVKNEKISLRFISYVTALFCYPPLAAANGLLPAIEYLLESRLFDQPNSPAPRNEVCIHLLARH